MNWDQIEGKWDQYTGKIKEKWGKLTSDDMAVIKGKKEHFLGKLRERYGYTKEQSEKEVAAFMADCKCSDSPAMKNSSCS